MKQLRKRNNYTLSIEAQEIIDKIPKTDKSKFVSEAIKLKGCNHVWTPVSESGNDPHFAKCIKCGFRP